MHWLLSLLFSFSFVTDFKDPNFQYLGYTAKLNGEAYTGITLQFHPNRQLYKIQTFWNGKQTWKELRWHQNGVKSTEINFNSGLRHGPHKLWYPNGQVQYVKNYHMEKPHGEFWGWHSNGKLSDYHRFEMGTQLAHKTFISDGKPFHNFVFRDGQKVGLDGGEFCRTTR